MKSFSLLKQNLELKYVAVKIPPLVFFQHVDLMLTEKKNVIVILQNSKGGRVFKRFKICFDLKEETHFSMECYPVCVHTSTFLLQLYHFLVLT